MARVEDAAQEGILIMNKAERLAIAGQIAPILRSQGDKSKRKVKIVDKDGNIIGESTIGELQKQILKRAEIEFDVHEDKNPIYILCDICNKPIMFKTVTNNKGHSPKKRHPECYKEHRRLYSMHRRKQRDKLGLCIECGKKRENKTKYCSICLERYRKANKKK